MTLTRMFLKLWHYHIILYLFADFKTMILCLFTVYDSWNTFFLLKYGWWKLQPESWALVKLVIQNLIIFPFYQFIYIYIYIYILYIYIYVCVYENNHENNVSFRLSLLWLCGNSYGWCVCIYNIFNIFNIFNMKLLALSRRVS